MTPTTDPIQMLMTEHQLILAALDALEGFATALDQGRAPQPGDLGRFVDFIRLFADGRHHGKEEQILFDTMVDYGFPREGGPIAVMLADHEQNRGFTAIMAEGVGREAEWSAHDRTRIAAAAHAYVDLLRGHIWKEDNILYPMAANHLPEAAYSDIANACAAFEERQEPAALERWTAAVAELAARYPYEGPAVQPQQRAWGCA